MFKKYLKQNDYVLDLEAEIVFENEKLVEANDRNCIQPDFVKARYIRKSDDSWMPRGSYAPRAPLDPWDHPMRAYE